MRGQTWQLAALGAGAFLSVALALPLARGDARTPTIGVNEIKAGMKGYGLTVFKGTEPERFDFEVVDVLRNFRPSQELILIKTLHPRLAITKNVKGMSGSPIYLDGRLAGAYAYSWASFQVEPVAGVTPIAPMLAEMRRPIPPGFWPLESAGPLPKSPPAPEPRATRASTDFRGDPGTYDLDAHAQQLASRVVASGARTVTPVDTPIMMAGVGDRTAQHLSKILAPLGFSPLQAGGGQGTVPGAPQHYVNGGSVGVQLARGDISLMGLGTVTHIEGTRATAFGHPMMEGGTSALPTTLGRVLWIFASDQHSSKIGEAIRPLGAMIQDRMSSIVVDEKAVAPVFPVHVQVRGAQGAPKTSWDVEIAEDVFMGPGLAASIMGSVIEATALERRDVTWTMSSKLTIRGKGTLQLDDFGVAIGGMPDAGEFGHARIVRAIGDVLNNPWEHVRIERVETVIDLSYQRELWRLRGAELLDPVVDAGQSARIKLRLGSYVGPTAERIVDVKMPVEMAGKDVEVEIAPGYEVPNDLPSPENLSELLANETRQTAPPRSIVLQFKVSQGVAYRGHVAGRLPNFALDALRPANANTGPEGFVSYARTVVPLERYVEGRDRVRVKVRPVLR